ncbi:MAG TPA: ABC transporter permease, partial [Sphingomicrobium sp.]|nr:ABC transporter permease [Sphingomicrobium sp.]
LTESFVLACGSGAAGLIVAVWLPPQIVKLAWGNPTALQLAPDGIVLAFTLGTCLVSCLLFGLAPALHSTRRNAIAALKEDQALRGTRFSLRTMLLSVQVAAVVVLLASAGVMARSARQVTDRALGAVGRDLSVVSLAPPLRGYDAAETRAISLQLEQALDGTLASGSIALTSTAPLASGNIKGSFRLPGQADDLHNAVFEVSPAYFQVTGLRIIEGRSFTPADKERPVIIINETMAKEYWPGTSPVGQRIVCAPPESGWNMPGELEIVGVVKDSYMTDLGELQPTLFQPLTYRALPQALASDRGAADALRRAEIMTSEKSNSVKLAFGKNNLAITANSPDVGEARESIAINYKGKEMAIAFNPKYLIDALNALSNDEIFLDLIDELSPGVLKINGPFLYVVMPMRLS